MDPRLALVIAVSLLGSACSGGADESTPTTAAPPTTDSADPQPTTPVPTSAVPETTEATGTTEPAQVDVDTFSDDGDLGFRVAAGDADLDVSVRLLDSSEWPIEIAGGDNVPGVRIYELEPDGATFDEPVTVTRRLDLDRFAALDLGPKDIPLLTMLTQNDDGTFELLDDLDLLRVGDSLYVSGTTTHFSPIIVSNENRVLRYQPGEEIDSGEPVPVLVDAQEQAINDAIDRALRNAPVVAQERYIEGAELDALLRDMIARQQAETADETDDVDPALIPFTPVDPGEFAEIEPLLIPDPLGPLPTGPTPDDAGFRAQRLGVQIPFVPISLAPSAAALLRDPDVEFEMTVAVLELLVADDVLEAAVDEVVEDALSAWDFPDEVSFVYEVFHRIYGVYPSSVVKRYRNLRLPAGLVGYTTTWEGEVGPAGRLVSIGELSEDGDDLVGEAGIECFCEYLEAMLVVAGGFDEATLDSLTSEEVFGFLEDGATDEDDIEIEIALALLTNPTDNEEFGLNVELRFQVRDDEGAIFDGDAAFLEALTVIP